MRSFFSRFLTGSLVCVTVCSIAEETCLNPARYYRGAIRHIEKGGIGYDQGYTTLEFFLAPDVNQLAFKPFFDIRGHVFDNGKFAANAGFGIRAFKNCRIFGANIYYDYRQTKEQHYNQVGLGLETLGVLWDFRANAYLPVGTKISPFYDITTTSTAMFNTFQGHQALLKETFTSKGKVQFAMTGVNAEAAVHILKNDKVDLYAAFGPYYYKYDSKQAIGGQVRLKARVHKYVSIELINSYDSCFHEKIQGSVGIKVPFGPKVKISKNKQVANCSSPCLLAQRLMQDVERQEIIVVDKVYKTKVSEVIAPAINPLTGKPYFFVFVNNTSSSNGTYESPYPTLALAERNSSPGDIIYVFPGDNSTKGMNSGILLQPDQKLWGSGVNHLMQTTSGIIDIPAQTPSSPIITNTNDQTEGNTITLATNNAISGFTILSPLFDAIYGTDAQTLEVSSCTFENSERYPIEAIFSQDASISITNNQFLNNKNGIFLTLNGTSTFICSDNVFEGQTSESEFPVKVIAENNSFIAELENNLFNNNFTGSVLFALHTVNEVDISLLNNTMTNNKSGSVGLASSLTIIPNGTNNRCSVVARGNTFSDNTYLQPINSIYLDTSGEFNTLSVIASKNTMSNNSGSAIVLSTPVVDSLTLLATDNTISGIHNNAISVIATGTTTAGNITINNNTMRNIATDMGESENGISIAQGFTNLDLTILENIIDSCGGSGLNCYSNDSEFTNMSANISYNVISNCQNLGANAASAISLDTYRNLNSSVIAHNTFSNNAGDTVAVGINTEGDPAVCLTLVGNTSNVDPSYFLRNPGSGAFNLTPCNVDDVNVGSISPSGTITKVQSCSDPTMICPP